jgi:hypothetical protein
VIPAESLLPPESAAEPYRPLSLLAAGAFALAAVYALIIGGGGLYSLFTHTPLLLPVMLFGVPLVSVVLAWMARTRIQESEGTLSGLALAKWALTLSTLFGLVYAAWYVATALAVRQQARTFAEQWLKDLTQGKLDQAFWLTKVPRPATAPADLRRTLEMRYNSAPGLPSQGTPSGLALADYVRLMQMGGSDTTIEFHGFDNWGLDKGDYLVGMTWQLRTPLAAFLLHVTVKGSESRTKPREFEGRQWQVVLDRTGIVNAEGKQSASAIEFSKEGPELAGFVARGKNLAMNWLRTVGETRLERAWLETLGPAERKAWSVTKASRANVPALALGSSYFQAGAGREAISWSSFINGNLIRGEKDGFWAADESIRQNVLTSVKNMFAPGGQHYKAMVQGPEGQYIPIFSLDGKRLRVEFDCFLGFDRGEQVPLLIETRVVVVFEPEGLDPNKELDPNTATWRVESLDLLRGKMMPERMDRPPAREAGGLGSP